MPETEPKVVGMHVRIPEAHITLAKIVARNENLTLAGFVDKLIVADIARQPDLIPELLQDLDTQIDELTLVKQSLMNIAESGVSHATN